MDQELLKTLLQFLRTFLPPFLTVPYSVSRIIDGGLEDVGCLKCPWKIKIDFELSEGPYTKFMKNKRTLIGIQQPGFATDAA